MITEGNVTIDIKTPTKVSKQMGTFYNPAMQLNRDVSVHMIAWLYQKRKKPLTIGLPLAGTGVRAARMLKETDSSVINIIHANDISKEATTIMEHTMQKNTCAKNKYTIHNTDANVFLAQSKGFDYIDIDPFGSPVPFIDTACQRISRNGILAVTATDTACLCGTYPKACKRKYNAYSERTPLMHETGIRILIRKVQTIAAQYDRAAIPILSYAKLHYMRVYFLMIKSKTKVDDMLAQHTYMTFNHDNGTWQTTHNSHNTIGPLWIGPLFDKTILTTLTATIKKTTETKVKTFIEQLTAEAHKDTLGFYDIPYYLKKNKTSGKPLQQYLDALHGVRTHFNPQGIKTTMSQKKVIEAIKKIANN